MIDRRRWVGLTLKGLVWLLLGAGAGLMVLSSLPYAELGGEHPFVLDKLPLRFEQLFLLALYVHVPSALVALTCCLLLILKVTQRRPLFHRWLGRLTGALIVLGVVPSGFWLAFTAKGGWSSTLGFIATGAITLYAMIQSIRAARGRQLREHRRYSLHVLGQLGVAVASRVLLVLAGGFELNEDAAYVLALWGPVVGALVLVELLTRSPRRSIVQQGGRDDGQIRRSIADDGDARGAPLGRGAAV